MTFCIKGLPKSDIFIGYLGGILVKIKLGNFFKLCGHYYGSYKDFKIPFFRHFLTLILTWEQGRTWAEPALNSGLYWQQGYCEGELVTSLDEVSLFFHLFSTIFY